MSAIFGLLANHTFLILFILYRLADTTAVINPPSTGVMGPPPPGKKKVEKDTIIMVPVHSEDFKKINEFSEAAWIMRDPANQDRIKETRKRLLQEVGSSWKKGSDGFEIYIVSRSCLFGLRLITNETISWVTLFN